MVYSNNKFAWDLEKNTTILKKKEHQSEKRNISRLNMVEQIVPAKEQNIFRWTYKCVCVLYYISLPSFNKLLTLAVYVHAIIQMCNFHSLNWIFTLKRSLKETLCFIFNHEAMTRPSGYMYDVLTTSTRNEDNGPQWK